MQCIRSGCNSQAERYAAHLVSLGGTAADCDNGGSGEAVYGHTCDSEIQGCHSIKQNTSKSTIIDSTCR